jgi:hypothetical protein
MSEEVLDYVPGSFYDDMAPSVDVMPSPAPEHASTFVSQPQMKLLPPSHTGGFGSSMDHKFISVPGQDMMPGALAPQDLVVNPYVQYPEYYPNRLMAEYPVGAFGQEPTEAQKQARFLVGMSVVAVGAGAAVGYTYGGLYGALAGALFGGTAANAYRAYSNVVKGTDEGDKEAKVSGTYAVVTAALGGFLWYKLVEKSKTGKMTENPEDAGDDGPDEPDETVKSKILPTQSACAIRKAE